MTLDPECKEENETEAVTADTTNEEILDSAADDAQAVTPNEASQDNDPQDEAVADAVMNEEANNAPVSDERVEAADTGDTAEVTEPAVPTEKTVYRWTYAEQMEANEKQAREKHSGLGLYITMVSAMFAVCILLLIVVLFIGGKTTAASYIGGDGTRVVYVRDGEDADLPKTPEEISLAVSPSVVGIRSSLTGGAVCEGAGIIISEDGYIITNYHVIQGATSVLVYLYGESGTAQTNFYRAKLVGAKSEYDLAVLKIEAGKLTPAVFGDSDDILIGDTVYAVGHPGGLDFGWTFSDGVVSGLNRTVTNEYKFTVTVIQSNVTVNTGNSGGPMLNDEGEVIGVITMKLSGDYQGMNFALPSNTAWATAQDIIENGGETDETDVINRPYIGITGCTATAGVWMFYNEETGNIYTITDAKHAELLGATYISANGVWVVSVMEDSGAYGKLQAGDLIVAVDDVEIITMDNMIEMMGGYAAGDDVFIRYIRNGETRETVIRLTEQNK